MNPAALLEATTRDLLGWYATRAARPSEVVDAYLRRVAALDLRTEGAPPVNSVVCVAPDALRQAEAVDAEIASNGVGKPLHGIPVWVKDNVDVQGLPTSSGCLALWDEVARHDAELVARLRRAGAVIMGKVGMTELGNGTSAFSTVSGRIGNAYDPRLPPGGSSSGAAVAVAMSFGALAVGVDDCGSIVDPAAYNGCVGLRPTIGLVSRSGLFSYSDSDTSPGPITRTVADAVTMLAVLASDSGEAARVRLPADPVAYLSEASLAGVRVGVLESIGRRRLAREQEAEERRSKMERCVAALEAAGAEVVRGVQLDDFRPERLSKLEYHNSLVRALRRRSAPPRSLRELTASARIAPSPTHGRSRVWARLGWSWPLPNVHDARYRRDRRHNREVLQTRLQRDGLSCLVAVTDYLPAMLATLTGSPHLTVPAGFAPLGESVEWSATGALAPFGLSFLGAPGTDFDLLRLGAAFERSSTLRQPPGLAALEGPFEPLDAPAFNRTKRAIAEASFHLLRRGPEGYEHPTADEFRDVVERVVQPGRTPEPGSYSARSGMETLVR